MNWFGLGKKRSKLGRYVDRVGISQTELAKLSGISRPTINRMCSEEDYEPNIKTVKKLIKALKRLDPNIKSDQFFDI